MKIKLLKAVRHNGVNYNAGDLLELNEKDAERLNQLGCAVSIKDDKEKSSGTKVVVDPKTKKRGGKIPSVQEKNAEAGVDPSGEAEEPAELTADEVMAELAAAGIPFDPASHLDELKAALEAVRAEK